MVVNRMEGIIKMEPSELSVLFDELENVVIIVEGELGDNSFSLMFPILEGLKKELRK